MTKLILKLPWFISAPTLVALAAVLAFGANLVLSDYFERTFLNDVNPLAAAALPATSVRPGAPAATGDGAASLAEATAPPPRAIAPAPTGAAVLPTTEPTAPAPPASQAGVLAQGQFRSGAPGHHGSGVAKLLRSEDGKLVLRFEDFSVTNGPDLFVILTKGTTGDVDSGLNLGRNKATDGNINYAIPDGVDPAQYGEVVIRCRAARINFAVATLEAS